MKGGPETTTGEPILEEKKMKKNRPSIGGLTTPRFLLGILLCSTSALFGFLTVAAPKPARVSPSLGRVQPVVRISSYNGVSRALRDLPAAPSTERDEVESEGLRKVKPDVPVPQDFHDPVRQSSTASSGAIKTAPAAAALPTPSATFEGMNQSEGCGGCIPPDPNGVVGPSEYVQMVNSAVSVYDKSGSRLMGPTAINSLWSNLPGTCKDNNDGDPIVIYDQLADRWIISQFAFPLDSNNLPAPPYDECIAVSKSADATGEYYIYDFHLSDQFLHDYPHFGLWPDAYYMTSHRFDHNNSLNYAGAGVFAFERAKMLNGQPAQMIAYSLGNGDTHFGGELAANVDGFTPPPAGAPGLIGEVDSSTDIPPNAALRIWKFHVDWTTPANSTLGNNTQPSSVVQVADFVRPNCSLAGNRAYVAGCVPQAGDPSQLDPIGDRLMHRLTYRNFGDHESLVLMHTVVADSTTMQMGPRWYEVRDPAGTPQIFQQSTFGPTSQTDPLYRFVGSAAMDHAGDIAIGYSTSSQANFPSIAYAGRVPSDPVNTLDGEVQMWAGTEAQHGESFTTQSGRWGDYSAMTVDPIDDCTFWYTTEYYDAADAVGTATGGWHTRIGNFKFSQCTPRQVGTLRGTVTDVNGNPIAQVDVTAGGYTAITDDNGFYQFSPLAPGAYNVTATEMGYDPDTATNVTIANNGVTTKNFTLQRNAQPTPTPAAPRLPLPNVNPPTLNDPGTTINTNSYSLNWGPAETATGLVGYAIEESTDYVQVFFDNADGTTPPGQSGSPWSTGPSRNPWTQDPTYSHSAPFSYFGNAQSGASADTTLTLTSNITIPNTVGSGRVSFWSRYYNDPDDSGNVEVSTDGGTKWTAVEVLRDAPSTPPADTRMQSEEVDLSSLRGTPLKLRFRFSNGTLVYFLIRSIGWWVDDINIDAGTWTQIATVDQNTTSLNFTNKPNGHYYYRVRALYSNGRFTTHSNIQDIVVDAPTPPLLQITDIAHLDNGHATLTGLTGSFTNVDVYSTDDLSQAFTKLGSAVSDGSGVIHFEDKSSTNLTQRFYRLALP